MGEAQNISEEQTVFLKVVTLGDSGVGKSSLIFRYIDGSFQTGYVTTIGVDFKVKILQVRDQRVKLQIWDTAGQERFRTIARAYLRGAHGCIGVFDLTSTESIHNLRIWLDEFIRENPNSPTHNLVIVGNKSDLEGRTVTKEEINDLISRYNCMYLEASAKTGAEVNSVFEHLANQILSTRSSPSKPRENEAIQVKKSLSKRWLCC